MYVAKIAGERKVEVHKATGGYVCTIYTSHPVVGVDVQGDQVAVRVRDSSGKEKIEIYRASNCSYIRTIY